MARRKSSDQLVSEAYSNPRYSGRHIVIIGGKIYAKKTGAAVSKMLETLLKKYPRETPTITYIPKEEILILCL